MKLLVYILACLVYPGTTLNYFLDGKINKAEILFPGVGCFLIAVCFGSAVHSSNAADNEAKLAVYSKDKAVYVFLDQIFASKLAFQQFTTFSLFECVCLLIEFSFYSDKNAHAIASKQTNGNKGKTIYHNSVFSLFLLQEISCFNSKVL